MNIQEEKKESQMIEDIASGGRPGDKAMTSIYEYNEGLLMAFCKKRGLNIQDSEDVFCRTLEIFLRKCKEGLILTCAISTFLHGISRFLILQTMDKNKRDSGEEIDVEIKGSGDISNYDLFNKTEILSNAMNKLGKSSQQVLRLFYVEDLSMIDIADQMGFKSSDVAKTKKFKALKALKSIVEKDYKSEDLL